MALPTTTEYHQMETTTDFPMYADFIAAPASSMSSAAVEDLAQDLEQQHNQITFEIPTAHDLKHIDAMHTFNTLLQRIGNMAYNTVADTAAHQKTGEHVAAAGNTITTEQIAKSVVLDLADLNEHHQNADGTTGGELFESIFGGADMHTVINYLWIGVVTALVILSVIFILFSCYFYRKFREWKKCNKDIRTQLSVGDLYAAAASGLAPNLTCEQRLLNANGQAAAAAGSVTGSESVFYQIESPPCYTIATGLPTYDEALHHQHAHFSYGMKFMYPTLAAVHHHHQHQHQQQLAATATVSNWEKEELMRHQRNAAKQEKLCAEHKQKLPKALAAASVATLSSSSSSLTDCDDAPPAYADASIALLNTATSDVVACNGKLQDNVCINMDEHEQDMVMMNSSSSCVVVVA